MKVYIVMAGDKIAISFLGSPVYASMWEAELVAIQANEQAKKYGTPENFRVEEYLVI